VCLTHNDSFPIFLSTKKEFLLSSYQLISGIQQASNSHAWMFYFDKKENKFFLIMSFDYFSMLF